MRVASQHIFESWKIFLLACEKFAQTILVKADEVDNYKTAADFTGKKIAAQNGTTQWNLTTTQIPEVEAQPISLMNDGILMLMEGKVDGLACQTDVAQSFADNYDEE